MAVYMILDGDGYPLTTGLQGPEVSDEARQMAQKMADERGESVWLARSNPEFPNAADDEGEEFEPRLYVIVAQLTDGQVFDDEAHLGEYAGEEMTYPEALEAIEQLDAERRPDIVAYKAVLA